MQDSKHVNFLQNQVVGKMWLHRCWWRMLEAKSVGDKFEMLVADLIH